MPPQRSDSPLQDVIAFAFALLLLSLSAIVLAPPKGYLFSVCDFPQYYAAAKALLSGHGAQIYDVTYLAHIEQSYFPQMGSHYVVLFIAPFALLWLLPIGLFSPNIAMIIWQSSLPIALALAVILLKRVFDLSQRQTIWLAGLMTVFGPQWEAVRHEQLTPFLFLSYCASLFTLKHGRLLQSVMVMSTWFLKPLNFSTFLAFCLGCRKNKLLPCFAAVSAGILFLSLIFLGSASYNNYLEFLRHWLHHSPWHGLELTPTLRGQLLRIFPDREATLSAVGLFTFCFVTFLSFVLGHLYRKSTYWLEVNTLVCVPIGFVVCPHCFGYELLLLIPSFIVLLQMKLVGIYKWLRVIAFSVCTLFLMPIYNYIHYVYLAHGGVINPFFCALIVFSFCGTLLAFNKFPCNSK